MLLNSLSLKIIQYDELLNKTKQIRNSNKSIVLVTGVFDLLHPGHKHFLKKAKNEGDILLVCLESDERVRKIKGASRPIENITKRLQNIIKLPYVDFALALISNFDSIERKRFITLLKPNILAVSSHTFHIEAKRKLVEKNGGKLVIVMNQDKRYSTSLSISSKAVIKNEC